MGRIQNRGYGWKFHPNHDDRSISGRIGTHIDLIIFIFALAISLISMRTEAASATLSISAAGAEVGETVDVTVSVKSNDYIGYVYVILNYDATILQAPTSDAISGGSGTITFIIGSDTADVKEASTTISFTALKAGTSKLAIDSGTWGIDNNGDTLTLTTSDSSVTVAAAYTASTDATLSALKVTGTTASGASRTVTLSPSFSKNTTKYTARVESDIVTAVTTATANDSKASISISDAALSLKTGTNTVTVKVTAESGATKTYTVTITRKEEETTTQEPTTTEEETTEEETTEEETTEEEPTEEPTADVSDAILVTIDGEQRVLLREFDETLLPEGFEMAETTWDGETIQAGQGIYKDLTLVCTADENGENLRLYILQDGEFLILRNYQTNAVLYTILNLPDEEAPAGFESAVLVLGTDYAKEDEIMAWQNIASPDYYLLYVMNWDGETGYYLYDSAEGTFQRYDAGMWETESATEAETETTTVEVTTAETVTVATPVDATPTGDDTADHTADGDSGSGMWKYVMMLLEAVVILVLAALFIRAKRGGGNPPGGNSSGGNPPGGNSSGENPPGGNPLGGNPPGGNPSGGDPFGRETSGGKMSGGEMSEGEASGWEIPGKELFGGEPAGEKSVGGNLPGDNSDGVRLYGTRPYNSESAGNESAGGGSANRKTDSPVDGEAVEPEMSLNEYFSEFDEILAGLDGENKE